MTAAPLVAKLGRRIIERGICLCLDIVQISKYLNVQSKILVGSTIKRKYALFMFEIEARLMHNRHDFVISRVARLYRARHVILMTRVAKSY